MVHCCNIFRTPQRQHLPLIERHRLSSHEFATGQARPVVVRKTGTIGTLEIQAEIGVWVQAPGTPLR